MTDRERKPLDSSMGRFSQPQTITPEESEAAKGVKEASAQLSAPDGASTASPAAQGSLAARREAVYAARARLALDGIAAPPELEELGRQYIAGEPNLVDYQCLCREFGKRIT